MSTSKGEIVLFTFEGFGLSQVNVTIEEAEYYANKNCKRCWSKGYYKADTPVKRGQSFSFFQLCDCAKNRMKS